MAILTGDRFSDQFICASRGFSGLARLRNRHEPVHGGAIVLRREVRVTHRHLDTAVSHQFGHRAKINSRHNQPTCKGMTVAMPGVVLDLCFGQRLIEPATVVVLRIAPGVPKHIHLVGVFLPLLFQSGRMVLLRPYPILQGPACNCIERNVTRPAGLGLRQRNEAVLQRHIPLHQLELFSRSHSCVDRHKEGWNMLAPFVLECDQHLRLFGRAQESHPLVVFWLRLHQRGGIDREHVIVDGFAKHKRESIPVPVPRRRSPPTFVALRQQPGLYFVARDSLRRLVVEMLSDDLELDDELVVVLGRMALFRIEFGLLS